MEDLKKAVEAVNRARTAKDLAKVAFDKAEQDYDAAVNAARDAHADLMKWLTDAIPGLGAARREL